MSVLLVVKAAGSRLDTLYRVDDKGFFNSRGKSELKITAKDYHGFKLYPERKNMTDSFAIGDVDRKGVMYSDDNDYFIPWEYKKRVFEYYPMP